MLQLHSRLCRKKCTNVETVYFLGLHIRCRLCVPNIISSGACFKKTAPRQRWRACLIQRKNSQYFRCPVWNWKAETHCNTITSYWHLSDRRGLRHHLYLLWSDRHLWHRHHLIVALRHRRKPRHHWRWLIRQRSRHGWSKTRHQWPTTTAHCNAILTTWQTLLPYGYKASCAR